LTAKAFMSWVAERAQRIPDRLHDDHRGEPRPFGEVVRETSSRIVGRQNSMRPPDMMAPP
jgi:hypothetical protein